MVKLLLVGSGGFIGAIARYVLSGVIQRVTTVSFPYGTLTVNVIGCALAGVLMFLTEDKLAVSPALRLMFGIGFLGGFTTFSTFGYETIELLKDEQFLAASGYVLANVILGIAAVWIVYISIKTVNG